MNPAPIGLVAFDLDGTLLRGDTVCLRIARRIGRLERMREFEALVAEADIRAAREEMALWYHGLGPDDLCAHLAPEMLAPGAAEGFALLRERGIATAIVSITWDFATALPPTSPRWRASSSPSRQAARKHPGKLSPPHSLTAASTISSRRSATSISARQPIGSVSCGDVCPKSKSATMGKSYRRVRSSKTARSSAF